MWLAARSRMTSHHTEAARTVLGVGPLLRLHWEMTRLFQDVLTRIDVKERDDVLCIVAELRDDMSQQDLAVQFNANLLTVVGDRKRATESDPAGSDELNYCRFRRTVQLPFSPAPDQVEASLRQGVFTIRMPKSAGYSAPAAPAQ
jgi:HSP20 family molecular chaperone IbpA